MSSRFTRRSALLIPTLALGRAPDLTQTDLFTQGEGGVNTYRIPALLETARGTLLAVADARHDGPRDLPARISLVVRRSLLPNRGRRGREPVPPSLGTVPRAARPLDRGRTWSPIQTLRAVREGGVGDASLLLDRKTGRIWCFHAFGPPGVGFATPAPNTLQVHAIHSDDDGVTWSAPSDLTPQLKNPAWQSIFATSGTHFQTAKGRYLLPLVVRDEHGKIASRNAYSDDGGQSWLVSPAIAPDTDESKVIELSGGGLLQNMRNGRRRTIARSADGVHFEAAAHDEALIDPGCNAGFARYRHGGRDLLLFTNAASEKRENISIRYSRDEGRTWSQPRTLHSGPGAYSAVIPLRDGSIAVLYERGDKSSVERITCARFRLDWLLSQ